MKRYHILIIAFVLIVAGSCKKSYLERIPGDVITVPTFWKSESDAYMALYGVYNSLQSWKLYGYGPGNDAMSPNAFQWAWWEGYEKMVGNGTISSGDGGIVSDRWTSCYQGIGRANYFLANVDKVPMDQATIDKLKGEALFLRGVFYLVLIDSYGGVPIITSPISIEDAKELSRASIEDSWAQVHSDFDAAASKIPADNVTGRASQGAAYGMNMRAYLYQGNWDKVIEYADKVIDLGKYGLFPSYNGIFLLENENNEEVIFDVQYMSGPFTQGSNFWYFRPVNLPFPTDGANSVVPIQNLVDAYETLDGSPVNPADPYNNRDPRLDFTVLRPGSVFQGKVYPTEISNHPGQRVGFGMRKYVVEGAEQPGNQSPLNFIVLRYADVLLSKAEALIEKASADVPAAVALINRIRTERADVNMPAVSTALSVADAKAKLRHERRIELAMEGLYWSDVRRWDIGSEVYPIEVLGSDGSLLETKFEAGYGDKYRYLPIPDSEISLNPNITQNSGY